MVCREGSARAPHLPSFARQAIGRCVAWRWQAGRSPGDGAACLVVDAHDFQNPLAPSVEKPIGRKGPRTNHQRRMVPPISTRSSSGVSPSPRLSERAASSRPASSSAVKVGTSSTDCRTYLPDGNDRISSGSCLPSKFRTTVMGKEYTGECPATTPLTLPLPGAPLSPGGPARPLSLRRAEVCP